MESETAGALVTEGGDATSAFRQGKHGTQSLMLCVHEQEYTPLGLERLYNHDWGHANEEVGGASHMDGRKGPLS